MSTAPDPAAAIPAGTHRRVGVREAEPPGPVDLRGRVDGLSAALSGGANVIMQLCWPEVGRGVVESTVDSGRADKRPFKRTRTTLSYLAVAMYGSEEVRAAYREAVNEQHRQVRSGPDSPVKYNAFSRDLQLWVASCLYYGARDVTLRMHGPMDEATEAAWFRAGRRMGTTLQVPAEMWHTDLAAFDDYWKRGLERASFDEETRTYLLRILRAEIFPAPVRLLFGPTIRFFNTGFLPAELRTQLGVTWSPRQERRHAALLRAYGRVCRRLPNVVRTFPFNALLLDVRVRRLLRRPLV